MRGVTSYIKGTVTITVGYPNGEIACQYCPFCFDARDGLKRWRCQLTTEYIFDPFGQRGNECPVKIEGEQRGEHTEDI